MGVGSGEYVGAETVGIVSIASFCYLEFFT